MTTDTTTPRVDAFTDNAIKNMSASGHLIAVTDFARTLERDLTAARQRIEGLETLRDRLQAEAQIHAQESRTQKATVHEIYQLVTGSTGEPGNWHGAEPVRAYIAAAEQRADAMGVPEGCTVADAQMLRKANHELAQTEHRLRQALRFYANAHHFELGDPEAWDTVSGEPQNYWCDEAGTATVEDGSIAKMALIGKPIDWNDEDGESQEPPPVSGEPEHQIALDAAAIASGAGES